MKGTLYGVGIGPGDPELLTLKAVRILQLCQVIAVPQTKGGKMLAFEIASQAVDLSKKEILPLFFSMDHKLENRKKYHQDAVQKIKVYLDAGQNVAMLNLGDVSLYATFCYLMESFQKEYPVEMVPGVPSFCAVAAVLKTSLTEIDTPLHIIPAGNFPIQQALSFPGTKVLMKSGKQIPQVIEKLKEEGLQERSALVQNCGLPDEKIYAGLEEPIENSGYFTTIIVKGGENE